MTDLLVQVSGPDKPGITAGLMEVLKGVPIVDVEQAVIRGILSLGLVLRLEEPDRKSVVMELLFKAKELGVSLEFQVVQDGSYKDRNRVVVTLLTQQLGADALGAVSKHLSHRGFNIDRILMLGTEPMYAVELHAAGPLDRFEQLRSDLFQAAMKSPNMDIAIQPERLFRRNKRLIAMDMDSTLIEVEFIDELAKAHGVGEEVSKITAAAMAGELDYEASLRARAKLLKGLSLEKIYEVADQIKITPGAETLVHVLKRMGLSVAVISGGFQILMERLKNRLSLDYCFGNELVVEHGVLTGEVKAPIVDRARKGELLKFIARSLNIDMAQTIAVGDGANDIDMLNAAGLGVAFDAKPAVAAATKTQIKTRHLGALLFFLGLHQHEIEGIDQA